MFLASRFPEVLKGCSSMSCFSFFFFIVLCVNLVTHLKFLFCLNILPWEVLYLLWIHEVGSYQDCVKQHACNPFSRGEFVFHVLIICTTEIIICKINQFINVKLYFQMFTKFWLLTWIYLGTYKLNCIMSSPVRRL